MEVGGVLTATFTWACKDETTPATTPAGAALATATYVSGNDVWAHQEIALTYAGGAVPVTGVTWTWEQPFALTGSSLTGPATRAKPIANGLATVTGTMTSEYFDQTFYAAFRSGAFASLVATATGTTAISGAEFPTFTNTFSGDPDPRLVADGRRPGPAGPERPVRREGRRRRERPVGVVYKSTDSAGRLVAAGTPCSVTVTTGTRRSRPGSWSGRSRGRVLR
jgi:hypothetical protein